MGLNSFKLMADAPAHINLLMYWFVSGEKREAVCCKKNNVAVTHALNALLTHYFKPPMVPQLTTPLTTKLLTKRAACCWTRSNIYQPK